MDRLGSRLAGGAHVILLPEIPFHLEPICQAIRQREARGHCFTILVVAEGVTIPDELEEQWKALRRVFPRAGAGNLIGDAIAVRTGKDVRVTVLGHIQRGSTPSPFDRILSTRFGVAAVDLIARGEFGRMVCLRQGEIDSVAIADAVGKLKLADPCGQLVQTAKSIGVCFGD
jgi:6-phosphofructokinase 1